MQYALKVFEYQNHEKFRTLEIDGQPWFVLADVCRALELQTKDGSFYHHGQRLDDDERRTVPRAWLDTSPYEREVKKKGAPLVIVISESGLYSLVLTSTKPQAKRFKKWITSEVLPAIRKTGSYLGLGRIPAFIRRYNENWDRVDAGHFSVINELGIGGFSLGLERAGFKTQAFCEIEPYCQKVLRKHWPHVPIYDDVRTLTAERLRADGIAVDAICGGFPCQDISLAGTGAGIEGERSGLWSEYARIVGELRPRVVIVENVAALLGRGLGRVLGDLAALGYDAEWHCIPASAVGAPHRRDRVWIVAYPARIFAGRENERTIGERIGTGSQSVSLADTPFNGREPRRLCAAAQVSRGRQSDRSGIGAHDVADSDFPRLERRFREILRECSDEWIARTSNPSISDSDLEPQGRAAIAWGQRHQWEFEPGVGRVAHGIPARVDRLRSLGSAVVPQIPEMIGRAILAQRFPLASPVETG